MLSTVIIFSVLLPIAADEPKVDPAVEQAKRLGIEKPTKAMRFKAIRSKKFDEEYVTVVDEEELKKLDLTPDEVREAMRRARSMDTDTELVPIATLSQVYKILDALIAKDAIRFV